MQSSDANVCTLPVLICAAEKDLFCLGVNSSRHSKKNHLNQLCVGLSDSQLEYSTEAVQPATALFIIYNQPHTLLLKTSCILFGLPLAHPRCRTLMPFSSPSHVTSADMNFQAMRDPITAEGCLSRTHRCERVPRIKRGMGESGMMHVCRSQ